MALISGGGAPPLGRHHHGMVWSPEADGLYVFGGENMKAEAIYRSCQSTVRSLLGRRCCKWQCFSQT